MPNYNPNSIWGSKEKKYVYEPANKPAIPPGAGKEVPTGKEPQSDESESVFHRHRFLFFGLGLVLVIALVVLVVYLVLPPSAPNILITFSDPGTVTVGEPFPLTVTVSNQSKNTLQNAELSIALPSGISVVGGDPTQRVITESVGTLNSQTINPPQALQLIETANPGMSAIIPATLTYETAQTGNAPFDTSADTSLTIGSQSALSLTYGAPSSIFSGQNFDLVVNYQNNTTSTLQGIQLQMQYPPAYTFVKTNATPPINLADSLWNLGTLAPNATGTLTITGNIAGPAQAQYQLSGTIGASFSGQNYSAASAPVSFTVIQSPLSLAVTLNNSSTYVAKLGDTLNYTLTYTNNSNVAFQNMNVTAVLAGQMYDFTSLKTAGSFNSQSDVITWYAANVPQLASLAPGQSGSVTFSINTQQSFPIHRINNNDFTLNVNAQIVSPTIPADTQGTSTASIASLTSKVGGEVVLGAGAYRSETTPGIKNTGPYPPVVNQPTQYTIHWDITNYSTDAKNVTVSAYLQSGTTFTGAVTSTIASSTPTYNAGTGLVSWTIPFIPATTGIISPPAQAVFQVSNTPAVNQVGQTVTLLGQTTLTATDAFTSSTVTVTAPAVSTHLLSDPSFSGQTGDVTQ